MAGYLIVNDVSVRDWQRATPTMTMGKSWDTHGPIGPWLVTADEIGDPHDLRIRTWVDGDLRQDASTKQMITNCWELIASCRLRSPCCPARSSPPARPRASAS